MTDDTRKPDAADTAPRPDQPSDASKAGKGEQDAPNYADRTDGGRAIPEDEVNSANDE